MPGKGVLYPRAGTLGGCTAHNAMITLYPDNSDFDGIAKLTGDRGWDSGRMRSLWPRIDKSEGQGGWLSTEQTNPLILLKDQKLLGMAAAAAVEEGVASEVVEKLFLQGGNVQLNPNEWRYVQSKSNGMNRGVSSDPECNGTT